MPVSEQLDRLQGELDRLYERLDQYEEDTADLVTSAYLDSLEEAARRIERTLEEADEPGEAAGQARMAVLQSTDATREIWESWRDRLIEIEGRVAQSFELVASVDGSVDSELDQATVQSLRGQWPDADTPVGSGLAGRFYNLSTHHRRKLADAVTRQVTVGADPRQLRQELEEQLDVSERQAKQHVRDATIQHSRTVNAHKAKDEGFEWFRYRGPLDGITRPFCRDLLESGDVFKREEIEAMDNGQTGAGTVFVAAGGYNCRHRWLMIRKRWFTDEEWSEMRGDPAAVEEYAAS